MPEKKKKHNPNTFLDWLIDYLIKPITDAIKGVIANPIELIRTVSPLSFIKDILAFIAPYVNEVDGAISSDKVKSPADAGVAAGVMLPTLDANLTTLAEALMYIETGSIGLIDISPEHMVNLPKYRFLETIATELRVEKFRAGFLNLYRRKMLGDYQPLLPEPYRLAEMVSKAIINQVDYVGAMGQNGLDSTWAWRWGETQVKYPDIGTALALLRRGEIDEATFYFWMQRSQINPEDTEAILKLKDVIPPIDDLIRFAVREAYLDHDPEKQYGEMVRIAGLMGLTPEHAEHYWYSHWDRIPVNLMYANYHRGLWTVEKLERMLKVVDVHPDDRKDIINVAYGVPSIREMGYGFDVGVYSLEDIKRFRRWGGLSPADAEKAGESMVAYRTEAERNSVRTELMYAYGLDKIDEDTLRTRLTEIKTPEAAIELWMTRAELYRERIKKPAMDLEGRIVSSSEALTAFKLGLRTEEWLRVQLKALDWTDERINTAVERAKLEIAEKEEKDAEVKYRKLTLAQIKQLYTIHIINKEQMTTEFVLVGYSPDDAELLTEIYTREVTVEVAPKPFTSAVASNMYALMMFDEDDLYDNFLLQDWDEGQAALLTMYTLVTQKYDSLRTQYIKGAISGEQMVKELMKLEMPEYNARLLVKKTYEEYEVDRLSHEKDLTKAEIIKGVKNQVLTPSQGAELLQGIGYDNSESWYILAINKVVAAGDPDGYWEMRRVTEAYKKAKGEKYIEVPDELIMLERQLKEAQSKLNELKKQPEREEEIKDLALKLIPIEQRIAEIVKKIT